MMKISSARPNEMRDSEPRFKGALIVPAAKNIGWIKFPGVHYAHRNDLPSLRQPGPAGSRFCPSCGGALSLSAAPTVTITPSPPWQTPVEQSLPNRGSPRATHLSSSDSLDEARFVPGATLVSRYRIIALLGRDGMGEVYRADDLKLGQAVAMKFLPEGLSLEGTALVRFHREVRLARQVSHPNVCRVFDIGDADGRTFLTMEYVDGEDLASLLRRIGRLPSDKSAGDCVAVVRGSGSGA
jgi:protein kinase-like protein